MCFFFKQKTAYEMRISDWSSDVCSSDLVEGLASLQYLRGEWPDVRVAVISSLQDRAWVRSAEALGAIAFIPKSTPVVQMQKILASLLTNGHWRSEERRGGEECVSTC